MTTNGIDPQVARRWFEESLRVYDALEEQKIANLNECRTIRARLPVIYESAKNAGLPIHAFKLAIKQKLYERKIEGLQQDIEGLVPDDDEDLAAEFEMLQAALGAFGDSPLGAAALEKAEQRVKKHLSAKKATIDSLADDHKDLRPRHLREKDCDVGAENAAKLKAGIKQLPN